MYTPEAMQTDLFSGRPIELCNVSVMYRVCQWCVPMVLCTIPHDTSIWLCFNWTSASEFRICFQPN